MIFERKTKKLKQVTVHLLKQTGMRLVIRRCSECKRGIGKPLIVIQAENSHLIELEWSEKELAKLKTVVERYTLWGASGVWRIQQ